MLTTSITASPLIGRKLCLLLVHLFLRIGLTEDWRIPSATSFSLVSQSSVRWLVEILALLPVGWENIATAVQAYCAHSDNS